MEIPWDEDRDEHWDETVSAVDDDYETKSLDPSQKSMLLYSSRMTVKPKGIVHTHAGALMQAAKEVYFGMDPKPSDRFFCFSDIGWIMRALDPDGGHAHGGTIFMYEGAPDHLEPDRFWRMINDYGITQFGISPTAIRAFRKQGDEWVREYDLSTLRVLGSIGELWDPESWLWVLRGGRRRHPDHQHLGWDRDMGCFLIPMPITPLKPAPSAVRDWG